jgi:hypothetical protein
MEETLRAHARRAAVAASARQSAGHEVDQLVRLGRRRREIAAGGEC